MFRVSTKDSRVLIYFRELLVRDLFFDEKLDVKDQLDEELRDLRLWLLPRLDRSRVDGGVARTLYGTPVEIKQTSETGEILYTIPSTIKHPLYYQVRVGDDIHLLESKQLTVHKRRKRNG